MRVRDILPLLLLTVILPLSGLSLDVTNHMPSTTSISTSTPVATPDASTPATTRVAQTQLQNYSSEPDSRLNQLVAYQYGGSSCGPQSTLVSCAVGFPVQPCQLSSLVTGCTVNNTVTSADPTSLYGTLQAEGILTMTGGWFNSTQMIDWNAQTQTTAGSNFGLPTFYGDKGVATSLYGGIGPSTDPSAYFNMSQSIVLYYGSPQSNSTTGGPNVATGVSFYAKALDGSDGLLQATLSCTSGFGNLVTGSGGSVSVTIPENPSLISPASNASLLTSDPGLISIHFKHYLWCGDVNDTTKGPFTLTLTILPWTIQGAVIGSGSSGTVTFSRIEVGQESTDVLSGNSLPSGSIPSFVPSPKHIASYDQQMNPSSGFVFSFTSAQASSLDSGYHSDMGFTVNENAMMVATSTTNGSCPPSRGSINSGDCAVNDWNGYEYTLFVFPIASDTVACSELVSLGAINRWIVAPLPFSSSYDMAFSNTVPPGETNTCATTIFPTGASEPSVLGYAYTGMGEETKAFVVPTVLYGYLGTRNPVDGEIALPSSVTLTPVQKAHIVSSSFLNVSWLDSWQNPLLQLLNPTGANNGEGGQPLYWHIPLQAGVLGVAAYNHAHGYALKTDPLTNDSGGCPTTNYFATGPEIPVTPSALSVWSTNPTNVTSSLCSPVFYFDYTPSLPFPVGYDLYQAWNSTAGNPIYAVGQTIPADNYIMNLSMPGFEIRESFSVPGLSGILLPYPFGSFKSLYQNTTPGSPGPQSTWWTSTTSDVSEECPLSYSTAALPPSTQPANTFTQSNVPSLQCGTGTPIALTKNTLHPATDIVSMTPDYGASCGPAGSGCGAVSGTPRDPSVFPLTMPANATAFTTHLPEEQASGYPAVISGVGITTLYAYTYNLSLGSVLVGGTQTPEIQEFLILASPLYAALNLASVTSTSCTAGGIVNSSLSGVQYCAGSNAVSNNTPIPAPTWQPVQPQPLGLHIGLASATPSAPGLSSSYVRPGPWLVRTSLSDIGNFAASFNNTCGINDSGIFNGPFPNLEAEAANSPPTNHSDISDPYWWSNTSTTGSFAAMPECANGYIDPYWAYGSNLHAGLLPLGSYTFSTSAPNYLNDSWNPLLNAPEGYNEALLMCEAKYYTNASSGCDLNHYNVYLFGLSVMNSSGGNTNLLTGTFVTVDVDGQPLTTIPMNTTGCGGFCNATLLLITSKTSSHNITFTDHLASTLTPLPYLPVSPLIESYALHPETNSTESFDPSWYWQPNLASCALSGSCGCSFNCGSTGLLGWLEANALSLLIIALAALIVAAIAYYLHRHGDDQLAGLEIAGGSFVVVAIAWLLLVAHGFLDDPIWLALLITGASIMAPGAGTLLALRDEHRPRRRSKRGSS